MLLVGSTIATWFLCGMICPIVSHDSRNTSSRLLSTSTLWRSCMCDYYSTSTQVATSTSVFSWQCVRKVWFGALRRIKCALIKTSTLTLLQKSEFTSTTDDHIHQSSFSLQKTKLLYCTVVENLPIRTFAEEKSLLYCC